MSRITALAEQVAASMGMQVVLAEIKGGGRSVVRVYIDKPGGISLDDCEHFSRRFSVLLDVEDCIPFSYVLEVSSPGLDRPLVREEDFIRFAGKRARLRMRQPVDGQRNFRGRLLGASHGSVRLEVAPGKEVELALSQVERANLVAEI
ncbi:MAG: ribosome maturation factor RimP [Acidobacteria bacterium]|nr:ribosome maturation factor RimP [Acidobacteriota bacterium]